MIDYLDDERAAQREEFLKREREKHNSSSQEFRPKKPGKAPKPKVLTFEQKLALTEQWLEETFSHLFAVDDYVPLDHQLLRDLKADVRQE